MFKSHLSLRLLDSTAVKNCLIFFLVASLLSGALIPDLIVTLFAILFLFNYFNKNYFSSNFFFYIFIFWVYLIMRSIFSLEPLERLVTSVPYIRFLFFIFFINIFFNNRVSLRFFLYSFLFIYCILLADSIYQLSTGHNILGKDLDPSGRVSSFFGRKLILGSFISKTFSILLFLIFFLRIKYKYFFYIFTLLISGILVYLSRERSSLFVFFITFIFSIFLIEKKYIYKIFFSIISLFIILIFIYSSPLERFYFHTKSQMSETGDIFMSERHKLHYLTAYRIFKNYPLFGAGVKTFRDLCDKDPYSVSDLIQKNKKNITIAKKDGYYLFIHDFIKYMNNSSIEYYNQVLIIDKNFFEQNILNNINNKNLIKEILRSNRQYYIGYTIPPKFYFNSNYIDFDYVKSGSEIFSLYEFNNGCNTHPHNFYMQFLSEIGIFGFLFLVLFYYFVTKSLFTRIIKYIKNNKISYDIAIFGFYFSVFFPLIPSGNFFNNNNSLLLFLPLAFIILCQRK
jgi:O-antigen ligase